MRRQRWRSGFRNEPAPWDRVQHLWDFGRAPERPDHPDHALAKVLQAGFFAALPSLEPALLARLVQAGLEATKAGPMLAPQALAKLADRQRGISALAE